MQNIEASYDIYEDDSWIDSGSQYIDSRKAVAEKTSPRSPADHTFKERSCLRCILQRSRPSHTSGRPDPLPFRNAETTRNVFRRLRLPTSYFQVADGSPATVYSYTTCTSSGDATKYELVAHVLTKQGDWAMALAHDLGDDSTSVFWSVDSRIDSATLKEDLFALQECAIHPMLIPCIMLAATLRMAIQRRHSIKGRLDWIEKRVARMSEIMAISSERAKDEGDDPADSPSSGELFELLNSCKKDQESRKGQYEFWNSFNEAIEEGFKYAHIMLSSKPSERHFKAHRELKKWKSLTWQRIRSIMARDGDHNNRVDNVSYAVCSCFFHHTERY